MTSTAQLKLKPGIYNIIVTFQNSNFDGRLLSDGNNYVTISPPNEVPDPKQEWLVTPVKDQEHVVTVQRPHAIGPLFHNYLTYKGVPEPPKLDDQIVVKQDLLADHYKWYLGVGPGFTNILRPNGSDLGIAIGLIPTPIPDPDPTLVLKDKEELYWRFEFLRDE